MRSAKLLRPRIELDIYAGSFKHLDWTIESGKPLSLPVFIRNPVVLLMGEGYEPACPIHIPRREILFSGFSETVFLVLESLILEDVHLRLNESERARKRTEKRINTPADTPANQLGALAKGEPVASGDVIQQPLL